MSTLLPSFPSSSTTSLSNTSPSSSYSTFSTDSTIPLYDTPSNDPPVKPPRKRKNRNISGQENGELYSEINDYNVQEDQEGKFVVLIKVNSDNDEFDLQSPNFNQFSSNYPSDSDVSLSISISTSNGSTSSPLILSYSPSPPPSPPVIHSNYSSHRIEDLPPPPSINTLHHLDAVQG